jgi:hypothetical protein
VLSAEAAIMQWQRQWQSQWHWMQWKWISCVALVITGALTLGTASVESHRPHHPPPPPAPVVEVFTRELDNPRGLQFGPDGKLYVAEAGSGGTESTADICPDLQIGPPFGPYVNGPTARVSRIDRHGIRQTVIDGLPSGQTVIPDWQGVADVAFIDHRLFALVQGGGCSYGSATFPKSIIEVNTRTGHYRQVADLGAFRRAHPAALPDDDLEPEGVYFSLEAAFGKLYVVDVNAGQLLEVRLDGRIRIVADFTAQFGHIAPSALAQAGPLLIVGNIFQFPIVDGASGLFVVAPQIPFPPSIAAKKFLAERPLTAQPSGLAAPTHAGASEIASGLTAVIDLAFDHHGKLYALEMGNGQGSGFPDPEAGRVVRVHPNGRKEVVLTGLTFPTGMTFGRDRRLYISNKGFEIPSKGTGEILAVDLDGRH